MTEILVVVDVQNDFCEGGSLAVLGGADVAESISRYIEKFGDDYDYIFATRDWHNPLPDTNGGHFSETPDYVDSWPVHCVKYTTGADYHPNLRLPARTVHVLKGEGFPEYSAGSVLAPYLMFFSERSVTVDVVGIAFDYCVKNTAIHLHRLPAVGNVGVCTSLSVPVHNDKESMQAVIDELRQENVGLLDFGWLDF